MDSNLSWEAAPVADLNVRLIGETVLRLPLAGLALGHRSLEKSDVYLHAGSREAEYVNDVAFGLARGRMTLHDFAEKWFGSEANGRDLLLDMLERDRLREAASDRPREAIA